jgi:dihydrofolate reductase
MIGIDHLASAAMARSVYYAAMSLDGYIADLDENLEWLTGFDGPGYAGDAEHRGPMESSYPAFMEGIGALVMGSKTYEFILGQSWAYGDLPVWVLTSRELPAVEEASGLRFASGPVTAIHDEAMEAATGKDLWVVGGGNVATQYLEAGLLDVVQVTIVPVVLGDGLPLFAGPVPPLKLIDVTPYGNGMVELTYEVVM